MTVKLYKYSPPKNKLENEEFEFLENYLQQKAWLTRLADLNDPFEGIFKFRNIAPKELANDSQFSDVFNQHFQDAKKTEPDLTEDTYRKTLNSAEFNSAIHDVDQKQITDFFHDHGALCLTDDCSNIPMWAHYADNHKGYCVIFEIDFNSITDTDDPETARTYEQDFINGNKIICAKPHGIELAFFKVLYSDTPPTLDLKESNEYKNECEYDKTRYIVNNSFRVKFKQWEYENEYRVIANQNSKHGGGLVDLVTYLPCLKVTGVIVGKNMEEEKSDRAHALCNKYRKEFYKARCSETEYKINTL